MIEGLFTLAIGTCQPILFGITFYYVLTGNAYSMVWAAMGAGAAGMLLRKRQPIHITVTNRGDGDYDDGLIADEYVPVLPFVGRNHILETRN